MIRKKKGKLRFGSHYIFVFFLHITSHSTITVTHRQDPYAGKMHFHFMETLMRVVSY